MASVVAIAGGRAECTRFLVWFAPATPIQQTARDHQRHDGTGCPERSGGTSESKLELTTSSHEGRSRRRHLVSCALRSRLAGSTADSLDAPTFFSKCTEPKTVHDAKAPMRGSLLLVRRGETA